MIFKTCKIKQTFQTYLERISIFIKATYDKAKHTIVAATSPVTCGHTSNRLWPNGSGLGIAPWICSIVNGPRLRTDGINRVVVASLKS